MAEQSGSVQPSKATLDAKTSLLSEVDELQRNLRYFAAIETCKAVINSLNSEELGGLSKILQNMSIVCSTLKNPSRALLYSLQSILVDPKSVKGFFYAALSLSQLKESYTCASLLSQGEAIQGMPFEPTLTKNISTTKKMRWDSRDAWEDYVSILLKHFDSMIELPILFDEPSEESSTKTASEWRALGNEEFKNKNYFVALQRYLGALRATHCTPFLLKIAQCLYSLGEYFEAALYAHFVLFLEPLDPAHHVFLANCWKEAVPFLDRMLKSTNNSLRFLGKFQEKISSEKAKNDWKDLENLSKTPPKQAVLNDRTRRDYDKETFQKNRPPVIGIAKAILKSREINDMALQIEKKKLAMPKGNVKVVDIPPFHKEIYAHKASLPKDIDLEMWMTFLESRYEDYRSIKSQTMIFIQDKDSATLQSQAYTRLQGASPEAYKHWKETDVGSILGWLPTKLGYFATCYSFGNSPYQTINQLYFGNKHLAIGFVDLGVFLVNEIQGNPDPKHPFHFHGVELSTLSTLKTLIIADMLKTETVTEESIFQVWFSSTWTRDTEKNFRAAVKRLCDESYRKTNHIVLTEKMQVLLWHWHDVKSISLKHAYEQWFADHQHSIPHFENLADPQDRLDYMKYYLSGELLGPGEVGSIVMFALPPSIGWYELSEDVMQTLRLTAQIFHRPSHQSFVKSLTNWYLKGIGTLRKQVLKGFVVITVQHAQVSLDNPSLLKELASLKASTISWNNVNDYIPPKDYFELARQVSCQNKKARHYLYSMNWGMEVQGAFLVDYPTSMRTQVAESCEAVVTNIMSKIDSALFAQTGKHCIRIPLNESMSTFVPLAMLLEYGGMWLKHFFSHSGFLKDEKAMLKYVESYAPETFILFNQNMFQLPMSFTFDPTP